MRYINLAIALCYFWFLATDALSRDLDLKSKDERIKAFPEAEGFGAYSRGGRGGKVYLVTTLDDYPREGRPVEGTLRAAIEASGPRIVVFRVTGIISLIDKLVVKNPYLTIAGQTAPGQGITLRNYELMILTHDVIVRHLRVRVGDLKSTGSDDLDAITISGNPLSTAYDIIIDHCSATWATDENISSTRDSGRITVQWCIIAEGIKPHSMGSIIGHNKDGVSYHHNLYACNEIRNPKLGGAILKKEVEYPAIIDFRNNVIYNWGDDELSAGYSHDHYGNEIIYANYIGNYLRPGLDTPKHQRLYAFTLDSDNLKLYVEGNFIEGYPESASDNWLMMNDSKGGTRLDQPVAVASVRTDDAQTAFERVLNEAGATRPCRDVVDQRIIANVRSCTGHIPGSQDEVGGWPDFPPAVAPVDEDQDGMPDAWERQYRLDPTDPVDNNQDNDGDGYTNIEEYLNDTDPRMNDESVKVCD